MEFRIAPLILAIFNLVFMLVVNPEINPSVSLSAVTPFPKILIPFCIVLALSLGTYLQHSYYKKTFQIAYWCIQGCNVFLALFYVVCIQKQHL